MRNILENRCIEGLYYQGDTKLNSLYIDI